VNQGVAVLEISALGAALLVLDAAEKAAHVKLLQTESTKERKERTGIIGVQYRGLCLSFLFSSGAASLTPAQRFFMKSVDDNGDESG